MAENRNPASLAAGLASGMFGCRAERSEDKALNVDEIEADPAMLRNPGAREKRRNRSGQVAGAYKRHIDDPWSWRLVEMQESPAYRTLSLTAHKVIDRLEIELARHGFKPEANGHLPCTYPRFVSLPPSRVSQADLGSRRSRSVPPS
jgi:hypothetical protein